MTPTIEELKARQARHDTPERLPAPPAVEWTPAGLRVSGPLWEPHEALALAAEIGRRYGDRDA